MYIHIFMGLGRMLNYVHGSGQVLAVVAACVNEAERNFVDVAWLDQYIRTNNDYNLSLTDLFFK